MHFHRRHRKHPPAKYAVLTHIACGSFSITVTPSKNIHMATSFKKAEFETATVTLLDATGAPVTNPAASADLTTFQWSSSDLTIFTVTMSATNPLQAVVNGVADGSGTIAWQVKSADGTLIHGSDVVTIADAPPVIAAASGQISWSAPQPQVAPAA